MRYIVLETLLAVAFYLSLSISFYIEEDFIGTGLILGTGTVVIVILYNMANRSEHPFMKRLKELF